MNHSLVRAGKKDRQIELINFGLESAEIDILTGQWLELEVGNFEPAGLHVIPLSFIDRPVGVTLTAFQFLKPYSSPPFC
jgi:hypothetical protein